MEQDWNKLFKSDCSCQVKLFPNEWNPLHKKPVVLTYSNGYFYGNNGPDYYFGDVEDYNDGFEIVKEKNR